MSIRPGLRRKLTRRCKEPEEYAFRETTHLENLTLHTLCDGMMRIRDNAAALLEDARLLRQNGRKCRAYTLAYMACEKAGKLSILIGAATQIVLGISVDWKTTRKRFRSHDSKASQFMGLANAMPIIRAAAEAGERTVDIEDLMMKAAAGVLVGPALFAQRNSSIYCDFADGAFTSPDQQISDEMADRMIEYATQDVAAAKLMLGYSIEETANKLAEKMSKAKYKSIMSRSAEAAELIHAAYSALKSK
jgi:AbiV family abortive infection protein